MMIEAPCDEFLIAPVAHRREFRPDRDPDHSGRSVQSGGFAASGINAEGDGPSASCEIGYLLRLGDDLIV